MLNHVQASCGRHTLITHLLMFFSTSVNKETGQLNISKYEIGDENQGNVVYSGGNCEVLSRLIGAKGKDVLYVGDHIFGDVVKSKNIRGCRTFLIVPELDDEV